MLWCVIALNCNIGSIHRIYIKNIDSYINMLSIKTRSYYYLLTIKDYMRRIRKVHYINKDYVHVFRNQLAFCKFKHKHKIFFIKKSKYILNTTYLLQLMYKNSNCGYLCLFIYLSTYLRFRLSRESTSQNRL